MKVGDSDGGVVDTCCVFGYCTICFLFIYFHLVDGDDNDDDVNDINK